VKRYKTDRKGNGIYALLTKKVLLAFAVLLLMQALFYFSNSSILHPEEKAEWFGILLGNCIFGMATVTTFLLPYLVLMLLPLRLRWKRWYRIVAEVLYVAGVLLIVVPRASNAAYYPFTYRLLSDEIFAYFGIGGQMGTLWPLFLRDYWFAWLFPLIILALFFFLNSRIRLAPCNDGRNRLLGDLLGFVAGGALVFFLMRGGFGDAIKPSDAASFAQPKNAALVNNDAYNILRTLFTPDLEEAEYMPRNEADGHFSAIHTPADIEADSLERKPNIVLIVVESLGQEFMGCYNTQTGADTRTPFLDSLARHCTLFDGRANGKKSIEGITAINTSIPNLMSIPFTNSIYDTAEYTGLPALLKKYGYHTAFYHGTYNGVMDFDRVCRRIGFDEYHGKNEYISSGYGGEDDYDGAWGIFDEPFLQYTVQDINKRQGPFFAEIFTVTSHHPYPLPVQYKDTFKDGRHPILKCVEYTDMSLRRFFDEARKQPWFDSTLFIILGDHSGPGLSAEYNDYDGWYRIPMMVYDPQNPVGQRNPRIVQQLDLYPSIADLLGLPDTFVCFGQSLLQEPLGRQVYYGNGFYCMVSNNAVAPEVHDITVVEGDYEEGRPEDLRFLKALIQQYNYKIIHNKLISQ
jgi:phosphoglycerol transferase MdoB-like AlkP superfamily enzyme